jgi:hypothetical protein
MPLKSKRIPFSMVWTPSCTFKVKSMDFILSFCRSSVRAVLRLRHDANADCWTLTLKGKAKLVDGISRVEEVSSRVFI